MKFSLRQLEIFQQVAEKKSVSEAAKALHLSQSAASMGLAQLESMLGQPLFIRQGRQMELTHWGFWLQPHVQDVLAGCHTIAMGMADLDIVSGQIHIGASQTPAEQLVGELISEMDHNYPRLNIGLDVENTENVINGLLDYRYNIGVIEGHCDDARIERQVWCKDELVIVASCKHPFSRQILTSLSQLEESNWILRERGAGTREIFDSSIHKHLDQIKVHRVYDQVNVILPLVAGSQYLSCLSYRSVKPWVESGKLNILSVPELDMNREFSLIWRKQELDNPIRQAILKTANKIVS
jgi:DNA-binding transcriptional LysR family regulator